MDTKLITKNLKTHWAGKKILFKESVDSTNSWASQCLEKEPRGTIFLAGFQTAGHGRMKRGWESPAGKNILLSLIDKPPGDEGRTHQLTLVAGIGFASGLASLFPKLSLGLKWPNDIVVSGKKLGGILCEFDPKPGKVVIGVGLNVNAGKNDFSAEVQKIATSLSIETGKSSPLEPLIAACLNGYETWREAYESRGVGAIIQAWDERSVLRGKKVKIVEDGTAIEGIAEGLDANGFLIVNQSGRKQTVITGDVNLL